MSPICQTCIDRPDGCWKAVPYDCELKYNEAGNRAQRSHQCPLGKLSRKPCLVCDFDDPVKFGVPHVHALKQLASRTYAPPTDLQGNGIVYTFTGGLKFWPMVVVGVKLMREIGITHPIKIICDAWGSELDGLAEIIDLKDMLIRHPARYISRFAIKDYAIAHSGYEKCLFLDTDAYLVKDPEPLFDILSYVPFAYWSDFDRNMIQNWDLLGGPPSKIPHQIQGGHILVNLSSPLGWKEIMLSRWYSNHADYWWGKFPWHDESGHCVALTQGGIPWRVVEPAHWERAGFGCYYEGEQYIVHRVRCKLLVGEGRTARGAPYESRVMQLFRELVPPPFKEPQEVKVSRLRAARRAVLAR